MKIPAVKAVKPENRYNIEEAGIMEGPGHNGLVLGSSQKKVTIVKNAGSRSWIIILEYISAVGRALSSLVIFKGKTVQQQWFLGNLVFLNTWDFISSKKQKKC